MTDARSPVQAEELSLIEDGTDEEEERTDRLLRDVVRLTQLEIDALEGKQGPEKAEALARMPKPPLVEYRRAYLRTVEANLRARITRRQLRRVRAVAIAARAGDADAIQAALAALKPGDLESSTVQTVTR
jgi:hypothetical protein